MKEISLRVLWTNSVGHKTELIRCTLSQYCDYDIVKKSVGMSLVNLRIFAKYYYESPTSEHSCWADEPMVDIEIVYLRKMGENLKSSVLQMLFYGRRIITMHIRLMSFLSDAKIGSYFLFLLVDVFCLGVVDIFQTNYFLGFIHLYIFGKLMKCWTNVKISIFKSKYIFI